MTETDPLAQLQTELAKAQEQSDKLPKMLPDNPNALRGWLIDWAIPLMMRQSRLLARVFNVAGEGQQMGQMAYGAAMQMVSQEALHEISTVVDLIADADTDEERETYIDAIRVALTRAGHYEYFGEEHTAAEAASFEGGAFDGAPAPEAQTTVQTEGPVEVPVAADAADGAEGAEAAPAEQVIDAETVESVPAEPAPEF